MFQKQSLLHAFLHMAALAIGYAVGYIMFEKSSFGLLTAWWLSLYVGFLANIGVRAITPITVAVIAVLLLDVLFDLGWFYVEGSTASPFAYFAISLAYGLAIVVSPILVNASVRRFRS